MDAAISLARTRVLVIGAAVCGVLSLGLPWGSAVGGWPGGCINVMDADGYWVPVCGLDPGLFGLTVLETTGSAGAQTAARVFVVFVAVAAVVALRAGSRDWARATVVTAGAGLLLSGFSASAGPLVYLAGAIMLALALRKAGLLGKPVASAATANLP